ncbi:MAG TPA: hypothetical protein PLE73_05040 [Spirochaetota bacterium]|nr:hypothetical protein [Spirochaetota bacterium]HPI22538.1 hypothetical protein [Spirochaetota bacterium]HPU87960.1 hypothetical protein [Spirochaetota bacterium]
MTEQTDAGTGGPVSAGDSGAKRAATLTVVGLLFVFAAFIILYRAERTNNRQWIAKKAERVDPAAPGAGARMVKFTGVPGGTFLDDADSGRRFVYLRRSRYEFRRGADAAAAPDWQYASGSTERAKEVRIGAVGIRLDEAEIIGGGAWSTTVYKNGREAAPRIGDVKISLSGIPAELPLFCAGYFSNGYLGAGDLFVVSSFSEGKTMDELAETWVWRWLRHPACFALMLVGLLLLGGPAMRTMKRHEEMPVVRSLARIGWPAYGAMSLACAFLLVRFSPVTVDLIWLILALVIGVPIAITVRSVRSHRGA